MTRPPVRHVIDGARRAARRELTAARSTRARAARLCVAYTVAIAIVVLAVELPRTIDRLGSIADDNAALSFADREIAGGNAVLADQLLAYEARAIIPDRAAYRLVVGPKVTKQAALPVTSLGGWLTYFLMPRRPAPRAPWIVCYGCDPAQLDGRYTPLWQDEFGISVGRLTG